MQDQTIFGLAFILLGFGLFALRVYRVRKARRKLGYPAAKGRVSSTSVRREEHTERRDDGFTETTVTFHPQVIYAFEVQGREYEGKRIHVMDEPSFNRQEAAEGYLQPYPEGAEVNVRYNPAQPEDCYLVSDIGGKTVDLTTWILTIVFVAVGIAVMAVGG